MKIIGLTGQPSSGKDTAADFFISHGFAHYSTGDLLREEMRKAGIPLDRPHMSAFAKEMKQKHGMGYLAELAADRITGDTVVSGIRAALEVGILRERFGKDFTLLVIDAPIETRYERARKRGRPGDDATFEQFKAIEDRERSDPSGAQEVDKVISLGDHIIDNSGTMDELKSQLGGFL